MEACDRRLYSKIKGNVNNPLHDLLPRTKESSNRLRFKSSQFPRINTNRFKDSFVNRLVFKYKLAF